MRIAGWITNATDTLRIYNTYCFFAAKMFTRTHLTVTLHLHCLSQNTPLIEEVLSDQGNQWTF